MLGRWRKCGYLAMAYLAGKLTCSGLHKTEEKLHAPDPRETYECTQETEHIGQFRELHCHVFLLYRYPRFQDVGKSTH